MEEYVFRFPLLRDSGSRLHNLNDMFGIHLRELLDLLVLTSGDQEVKVDGYRLLNDHNTIHPLYSPECRGISESPTPLDLYEPRLSYIRRILESLLSIIDLEIHGETVDVNGFRLKNLQQWLGPGGGAHDILAHAASRCNLSCRFCYNKGTPPILRPTPREPADEYNEVQTRIKHYVPRAKLNIFPNMGSPCEALAHPHILEILHSLRQKTLESLRIPTNGLRLTPEMIRALKELKPISLDISLNSASPTRRQWLMADPQPQIALQSLARLKDARIPYSVVIVPWPFPSREVMLEDLQKTVAFAAGHNPAFIQVSLPGYSRFFPQEEIFPHEEVWNELKTAVKELCTTTECPVVLRPGLFGEFPDPSRVNMPYVIGAIKNSPAAKAGVRNGDCLLKVNGLHVKNRSQARSLMAILHQSDLTKASLSIQRDGTNLDLGLNLFDFDYPYTPETSTHLGAVFPSSGIPQEWVERLQQVIASRHAKNVLLLTSPLVRPVLEKLIRENGILSGISLHLRVPRNRYLGGNIFMGDLLVVQDFVESVEGFLDQGNVPPNLVVIPSSPFHLSGWGRDITGRSYLEIERHTKIPVALVECNPLFD